MIDTRAMRRKSNIAGWVMITPALVSVCLFVVYPVLYSVGISFTDWRFLNINVRYAGLENYRWLFSGEALSFWRGIYLSLIFTAVSTLIQTILGFFMAYILYRMSKKLQSVYRVVMYLPVVLPMSMVMVMFRFFLEPEGLVDFIFRHWLRVSHTPNWLDTEWLTMAVVIGINTWRFAGITIIIYFVAMNNVDRHVIESAQIDGCNQWNTLTQILLPLTWSSTKINLILSVIGGLKSYDFFLVLTNGQGDTQVVGMYIYKTAFEYRTFCRAVVMSLFMTLVIGTITFFVNAAAQKGEKT